MSSAKKGAVKGRHSCCQHPESVHAKPAGARGSVTFSLEHPVADCWVGRIWPCIGTTTTGSSLVHRVYAIPAEPVHTFSPHLRSHSVFTPFVHKILDPFTQVFTNLKRGSQCRASCPHQCSRSVVGSVSAARHTADQRGPASGFSVSCSPVRDSLLKAEVQPTLGPSG